MACRRSHALQLAKSDRSFGLLAALIAIFVVLVQGQIAVQGQNTLQTKCPAFFLPGLNLVRCVINKTGVAGAGCPAGKPDQLVIDRTDSTGNILYDCKTHPVYPPASCVNIEDMCQCTKYDPGTGTYTYTQRFWAVKGEHDGHTIRCTLVSCLSGTITTGPACTVRFGQHSVQTECPQPFVAGVNNVRCVINKTDVAVSDCGTGAPNILYIDRFSGSGTKQPEGCKTPPVYPPTTCSDTGAVCECTSGDPGNATGTYIYTQRFTAVKGEHDGHKIACQVSPCFRGTLTTGPGCTIRFSNETEEEQEKETGLGMLPMVAGIAVGVVIVFAAIGFCLRSRSTTASLASPGVEIAPVTADPAANQLPAVLITVEGDAESGASSAFEESSVVDEESTVG